VTIAYFKFSTSVPWDKALFAHLMSELPLNFQRPILKYRRWQDAQASLIGKILLKRLLNTKYNINSLPTIQYSQHGKPFFTDLPLLDFNISHSGEFVVVAMVHDTKVGIDIERIENIDFIDFHEVFTHQERLNLIKSNQKIQLFYSYWVKKEAILKACGKGLTTPLNEVCAIDNLAFAADEKWLLVELNLAEDYICYVATNNLRRTLSIELLQATGTDILL